MSLPHMDTRVAYPVGDLRSTGTVLHAEPFGDHLAVVLDQTACHPVDAAWPDQPADQGTITFDEGDSAVEVEIVDCVVGATDGSALFIGDAVPVRKGTEGWAFLAVHLVDSAASAAAQPGASARVDIDEETRRALSAGHTGCHLASLALNAALADAWRKDVALDTLGVPDFDALACSSSRISPRGSTDHYRVGKSLRRKGFDPAALDDLDGLAERIDRTLAGWSGSDAAVSIDRDGELRCELPGGPAVIPCGGTHVGSLAEFSTVTVRLEREAVEGAVGFSMVTNVVPAG